MSTGQLRRDLQWLGERLGEAPLPDGPWADERRSIVGAIRDYLVPRLQHPDLPPVVAVVGLGGVGKSALVNALSGRPHSAEGAVRPVTTKPVVVAADRRAGEAWSAFEDRFRDLGPLRIVRDSGQTTVAVTLVDLPPIDQSRWDNVVSACDLVLFVTTPSRYADAAGWAEIQRLDALGTPVWVVMKRSEGDQDDVVVDMRRRLETAGVDAPVVAMIDGPPESDPAAPVRERLHAMASNRSFMREAVTARSAALIERAATLVDELEIRRASGEELIGHVDAAYGPAAEEVRSLVMSGSLGPGAAQAPWDETAERLAIVITRHIGTAAESTARAWSTTGEGESLLAGDGVGLWRHAGDATAVARQRLLEWPAEIEKVVGVRSRRPPTPARRAEIAEVVRRRALGDRSKIRRRVRRRLVDGVDSASDAALLRLAEIATGVVASDRARFVDRIGRRPDPELVRSLEELVASLRGPRGADGTEEASHPSTEDDDA